MRRPRPALSVAPVVVGIVVGLAATACGNGSGSGGTSGGPKAEMAAAVDRLSSTDVLTTTVGLGMSPAALQSFARAQGKQLSTADARALATANVVIEAKSANGHALSDNKSGQGTNIAVTGSSGGRQLLALRVIGGDAYLHADVRSVLALAHKSNVYREVKARAATLPEFVGAFVAGRWVSLAGAAAQGLLGTFGATPSGGGQGEASRITADLKKVVDGDVTIRKVGSDSRGDHLVLTGHSRKIATDMLQALGSDLPGGTLALSKVDPSKMHDRAVTLDAWVKDGVLSQVTVDLSQFTDTPGAHAPLTVTFDQSGGDITRPAGATPIDLTRLSGLMGALSS